MRQLHAFRRPGRARRIDQRDDVVGLYGGERRVDVEVLVGLLHVGECNRALRRVSIDDDHVLQVGQLPARLQHRRQVRLLDDRYTRARVGDDVADLLGGERLVDREGRGAERHGREVAEVELGPVAKHQRDAVAARDAEAGETSRDRVDAVAQLGPRERDVVVEGAHGDDVRMGGGGAPQRLAERRRADGGRRGVACDGAAFHLRLLRVVGSAGQPARRYRSSRAGLSARGSRRPASDRCRSTGRSRTA